MTDKELLERLKRMYIDESAKLRQAKLEKEKAAARRAVEVLGEVIDWIEREHAPKGEYVEIVRCKDCIYYETCNLSSSHWWKGGYTVDIEFCSFGERADA